MSVAMCGSSWAVDIYSRYACDLRSGWGGISGWFFFLFFFFFLLSSYYLQTYPPAYIANSPKCPTCPTADLIGWLRSSSPKTSLSSPNYSSTINPSSTTSPLSNTTSFFTTPIPLPLPLPRPPPAKSLASSAKRK